MQDSNKPDLDETHNVTDAHERTLRDAAAAAREKQVDEGGREPLSLWVFAASAVIMLVAGFALGNVGTVFNYDEIVKPGYVQESLSGGEDSGPQPMPALDAYMRKGGKIFKRCAACHGSDGKGSAAYPSLVGSEWALGDTDRLSMIILNGLSGPSSSGKDYGLMTAQGVGMSPSDLAAVMTFVRNSLGNSKGDVVTKEMAAAAIEISNARATAGAPVTADELSTNHLKPLPGDPLDSTQLVSPISLDPVEAE